VNRQRLAVRVEGEAGPGTTRQSEARRAGPAQHADRGRAGALLRLQRTHGNRYVQRLLATPAAAPVIQPKLRLGPAGDRYEQHADLLAAELADGQSPRTRIAQAGRGAGGVVDPAVYRLITDAGGQGAPLPASVRRNYERALRADFAPVCLHTGRGADDLNLRLRSSAVTVGHDIFFRRGQYDPVGEVGRELLAHELIHVVQQDGSADGGVIQQGRSRSRKSAKSAGKQVRSESESESESQKDDSGEEDYQDTRTTTTTRARAKTKTKAKKQNQTRAKRKRTEASGEGSEEEPPKKKANATEDIEVGYLDLDGMKKYLTTQKLTTDKEPKELSVGAVVWNINHLKAEDDETEEDKKAKKAKETKEAGQQAAVAKKAYDTAAILKAMETLKAQLGTVATDLTKAADAATDALGEPAKGREKAVAGTKRELSQLKRDIEELQARDLSVVLNDAITAMAAMSGQEQAKIGERADRLEQIRALNRVWKRLVRLDSVLFSGKPRLLEKVNARVSVRAALNTHQGAAKAIRAAIANLRRLLPPAELEAAASTLKRGTVVDLTTSTFFQSPAVNLVLINEMNLGIKALATAAEGTQGRLGLSTGPIMLAKGQKLPAGSSRQSPITIGAGDDAQQVVGRQYEYYPAMHRKGGERGLTPAGTFYVSTGGQFAVQDEAGTNSAIPWNKGDKVAKTFRGIVVHRYQQGGQEFWAGILHTTPAGKDLERTKIWPQIRIPLETLNDLARHFKIPLLVGGDFYIPAEGIVNAPSAAQRKEIEASDPGFVTTVKLWNLARNVYLTAQAEMAPDAMESSSRT
jgi:Domain of unknown function (DUF4157)